MYRGNLYKFTISDDAAALRRRLLGTGDRLVAEASGSDRVWGIGFAETVALVNRRRWGENLLGKVLMRVRGELREREERGYGEGKEGREGDEGGEEEERG